MKCNVEVPFDFCDKCKEFSPDFHHVDFWSSDGLYCRELVVNCNNEAVCRNFEEIRAKNMPVNED